MGYAGESTSRKASSDEAGNKNNNQENLSQEAGCSSAATNVVGKFELENAKRLWLT